MMELGRLVLDLKTEEEEGVGLLLKVVEIVLLPLMIKLEVLTTITWLVDLREVEVEMDENGENVEDNKVVLVWNNDDTLETEDEYDDVAEENHVEEV